MRKVALPLLVVALAQFGFAGSVITTGLKNGAAIINIDATTDGAANYSGPGQAYWYQPFSTTGNLLEYTFSPGTYTFTIVNPTDGAAAFVDPNDSRINSLYTAWTYNSPWITSWQAFNTSALTNPNEYQLITGAESTVSEGNANAAYQDAKTLGYYNQIITGDSGRTDQGPGFNYNVGTSYTFAQTTTLIFDVADYDLADNSGGVSVLVQPAPEPNMALLLIPVGLFVAIKRRR